MKYVDYLRTLIVSLIFTISGYAQSGIGTSNPQATLDIVANPTDLNKVDGVLIPRLTGLEVKSKDNLYTNNQKGVIVYVTEGLKTIDTSLKTQKVITDGYFFYDGSMWQKVAIEEINDITATNGLSISNNIVELGGDLNKVTTIGTSSENTLKLTGLQDTQNKYSLVTIDSDGTLRKSTPNQVKGTLQGTYYLQGTSSVTVNAGKRVDVPGLIFTHTVPSNLESQTLSFNIVGFANKASGTSPGVQGVFELYQDGNKITSAFTSVSNDSTGSLGNLPTPGTILKNITLPPGTYTFKVMYKNWAGSAVINHNPTTFLGYDNDKEAMLTKVNVLIFNN